MDVVAVQVCRHFMNVVKHLERLIRAFVNQRQIMTFDDNRAVPHLNGLIPINDCQQTILS
ncbi:hypothetical protein D9M69_369370 [compost metagenome]